MAKTTKDFEGYTEKVFMEKGGRNAVPTVGSGLNVAEKHNQKIIPKDVVEGKRAITKEENDYAYNQNKKIAAKDSDAYGGSGFRKLHKHAQEAIEDMHYNMGGPRMQKFSKLREATQKGDYSRMADEIQYTDGTKKDKESLYYKQTKGRAKEHVKKLRDLVAGYDTDLAEKMVDGLS